MTRIIDHDPITNTTSYFHDNRDGTFTTWEEQDVTSILAYNQSVRNKTKRRDKWGPGKYVAEIPLSVLMDLRAKGILDDPKVFERWLDRSENLPFKTANVSLSR